MDHTKLFTATSQAAVQRLDVNAAQRISRLGIACASINAVRSALRLNGCICRRRLTAAAGARDIERTVNNWRDSGNHDNDLLVSFGVSFV
jgi:hypothetical protein